MSILQDLDPQNAKINASTSPAGKTRKMAWMLAVLSFTGGMIWLFYNFQYAPSSTPSEPGTTLPASLATSSSPPEIAQAAPPRQATAPTPALTANEGSAQIRQNAPAVAESKIESNTGDKALAARAPESAKVDSGKEPPPPAKVAPSKAAPTTALAKASPVKASPAPETRAKTAKPAKLAQQKKPASKVSASKSTKKTVAGTASKGSTTAKAEKRPAERDIDIITAIVR
ncbi:MAG: hypothetical protein H6R15_464 [Proteobacteria bacterium]|nr:hypothetical protein [Pseudomonadota bacterium]